MYITTRRGSATSHSDVFLGYLCEGCGEPVTVTITIEGSKSGLGGGSTMNGIRGNDAARARTEKEKAFLEYLKSPNAKDPHSFCEKGGKAFEVKCPFCEHENVWQHPALINDHSGQAECFIFDSLSDAREWAVGFLRERKMTADKALTDRQIIDEIDQNILGDEMRISQLEQEKETSTEAMTLSALEEQDRMLEERIQNTSVFSKERKTLVKQKEELKKNLITARNENRKTVAKKENHIRLLRRHMILLAKRKKIYAGYAIRKEMENCLAYRLAEPGNEDGEHVSLDPLPQIVNVHLSAMIRENREQIEKALGLSGSKEG